MSPNRLQSIEAIFYEVSLNIDQEVIEKAKIFAKSEGRSLSNLVEDYLKTLIERKEEVFEGFTLVNAHSFSPEKWLNEKEPSKIIMAILGDYHKKNAKIIATRKF